MNICFFNWQESTGAAMGGGIQRATSLLAKELRRRGHSVEFYFEAIRTFRIPFATSILSSLFNHSRGERFCKFLKEHKIDVAVWHINGCHTPFPLKNLPCKLITVWHINPYSSERDCADYLIWKLKLRSRLAQGFIRCKPCRFLARKFLNFCRTKFFAYVCRHGDKFVLLSERFFPEFPLAKKFPDKVCAIPNIASYEAQTVDFSSKKKELLFVGRMDTNKQPHLLLQIWQHLQDRFPDWSLRFVGDGPYLPELKKLSASLGLKNVFFEGYQDPASYYRSASIFCLTSAFEGFGLVLVEAQAYGCVPVAFNSFSAVHDIIEDGVNGVLVPAFDLDKYAEKLAELMMNSELRTRLAENGQKSIAKFSDKAVGDAWGKLLGGGVAERKKNSCLLAE